MSVNLTAGSSGIRSRLRAAILSRRGIRVVDVGAALRSAPHDPFDHMLLGVRVAAVLNATAAGAGMIGDGSLEVGGEAAGLRYVDMDQIAGMIVQLAVRRPERLDATEADERAPFLPAGRKMSGQTERFHPVGKVLSWVMARVPELLGHRAARQWRARREDARRPQLRPEAIGNSCF